MAGGCADKAVWGSWDHEGSSDPMEAMLLLEILLEERREAELCSGLSICPVLYAVSRLPWADLRGQPAGIELGKCSLQCKYRKCIFYLKTTNWHGQSGGIFRRVGDF